MTVQQPSFNFFFIHPASNPLQLIIYFNKHEMMKHSSNFKRINKLQKLKWHIYDGLICRPFMFFFQKQRRKKNLISKVFSAEKMNHAKTQGGSWWLHYWRNGRGFGCYQGESKGVYRQSFCSLLHEIVASITSHDFAAVMICFMREDINLHPIFLSSQFQITNVCAITDNLVEKDESYIHPV